MKRVLQKKIPLIPQLIPFLCDVILGTTIRPSCVIGKGLTIIHRQCIEITGGAVIGKYVIIFHGVTIGEHGKKKDGTYHVGNRVKIFAGLEILGAITIEDDSAIGANSVVFCSVPQNLIALGIPAKVRRLNEKVVVDN